MNTSIYSDTELQQLQAAKVVTGFSEKLSRDEQGKLTGDAWELLPEPKPQLELELIGKDGTKLIYRLGPHMPRLRESDAPAGELGRPRPNP